MIFEIESIWVWNCLSLSCLGFIGFLKSVIFMSFANFWKVPSNNYFSFSQPYSFSFLLETRITQVLDLLVLLLRYLRLCKVFSPPFVSQIVVQNGKSYWLIFNFILSFHTISIIESIQSFLIHYCSSLSSSLYILSPYPQVLHPQIKPIKYKKYFGKKFQKVIISTFEFAILQ